MGTERRNYNDTITIAKRCLRLSVRNPDTLLTSIFLPGLMMVLFVSLFGSLIHIEGTSYMDYIIPGILLQCIGQCASATAVMINRDMAGGMLPRLCTLPVKRFSVLGGYIVEAFVRTSVTAAIVFLAAFLMGFRAAGWEAVPVFGILLFSSILTLSWAGILIGIAAKSAEGAGALSACIIILPYFSSGFVPVQELPEIMRGFARYQPMTPVIDTMRGALSGGGWEKGSFFAALLWCAGVSVLFGLVALLLFRRRIRR